MSFDLLAPHYRWLEFVLAGEKLQRARTAHLEKISPPHQVLICGEGAGRFLRAFRDTWPDAQITCLDFSEGMLAAAKKRGGSANVTFVHQDILQWQPPSEKFDLIATHFFLDCFQADQLEIVTEKISCAAKPAADWLLADFCAPESGLARWRAAAILKSMYLTFRLATRLPANGLIPPDSFLKKRGFTLRQRETSEWGLLHSDWWRREERVMASVP